MSIRTFFKSLTLTSPRPQPVRRSPPASRMRVEPLEDRCLLSGYTVTDLGALAGGVGSLVRDLNASGQVVGTLAPNNHFDPDSPTPERAVLWTNGAMIDLGTLGGRHSSAFGINDSGQVAGWAWTAGNDTYGFLVTPEDTDGDDTPDRWFRDVNADGANDLMTQLPIPALEISNNIWNGVGLTAVWARAFDISNSGRVVGGNFLWTPATPNGTTGTVTDLGMTAFAINDTGQVVGKSVTDPAMQAVLWRNGVVTVLGAGWANDINDSGQVTGWLQSDSVPSGGFLWTPTTPNGTVGTFADLPPVVQGNQTWSHGSGLNNLGDVVGSWHYSWYGDEGGSNEQWASVWTDGVPADLGAYGPDAEAINDAGQVITYHYLLTPVPDDVPRVSVTDAVVAEGNTGTRAATFTVSLSAASDQPVAVAYATASATASTGDYQAASGTLTFAPGETRKTVTVLVNGDRLGESNETFVVNLSNPTNATIADAQGVGTILDDESRMSISDVARAEGKKGRTTLFTFTVTLSAAYDQPVTMSFRTVNGTAKTSDGDYVARAGTLTFTPGETTKTVTIEVKGDGKREADEYFYLDLFGNSSNSLFTKSRGTGTIRNDD